MKIAQNQKKQNSSLISTILKKTYPVWIINYIQRAKLLLEKRKNNVNHIKDYTPPISTQFLELSRSVREQIKNKVFYHGIGGLGKKPMIS